MRRLSMLLLLTSACGEEAKPGRCEEFGENTDSGCAGVNLSTLCDDQFCVPDDATCKATFYVDDGASGSGSESDPFGDLPQAAALAVAGDCVAIAAGSYTGASFAGGVSLFGTGAGRVTVAGGDARAALDLGAGNGARIRGLRIAGPGVGLRIEGASALTVEEVAVEETGRAGIVLLDTEGGLRSVLVRNVTGDPGHGIYAEGEGQISIVDALVEGNVNVGVVAIETTLAIESSVIRANGGYGVALQGGGLASKLRNSTVTDNAVVGVLISGTTARMEALEVSATRTGSGGALLVSIQDGADVEATGSQLVDSEGLGVLVDGSRFLMEGGVCSGNQNRGLWVQGTTAAQIVDGRAVRLDGVEACDNGFSAIGATESAGLVIQNGIVCRTRMLAVVDDQGRTIRAGDGVQALAGSDVAVDGLRFEANERVAALFDASTGGVAHSVLVGGGGEAGLVIQNGVPIDDFIGNTDGNGNPVDPVEAQEPLDIAASRLAPAGQVAPTDL